MGDNDRRTDPFDSLSTPMRTPMTKLFTVSNLTLAILLVAFWPSARLSAQEPVIWEIDNLKSIGGHKVTVEGAPRIVDAPRGKAVEFDGVDDALFLPVHPMAGWRQFTAEVIFRPTSGGPKEQRFFHLQEDGSENRVLFETRLPGDGQWFLDTYIKSAGGECTLFAEGHRHKLDAWHHAAIVVDGQSMRHYVDGQLELTKELKFTPHAAGQTSLGVRFNKIHWFEGDIARARFTPRVLAPGEFMK